jgi:superfamily II DNA or RNA helicase
MYFKYIADARIDAAIIASEDAIKEKKWGVVSAATGSGKTEVISHLCSDAIRRILITVPTLYLLNQLSVYLELKYPKDIGLYYNLRKDIRKRITICTLQSLTTMVEAKAYEPVSLWIADECHRTETVKVKQAVIKYMCPTTAIGFTATAFRASKKEELSLFTDLIYKYTVQDAIKDKSLVPLKFITWGKKGYIVDEASIEMIKNIIADQVGPGLVNSSSIQDCEAFSARLCSEGKLDV